MQKAKTIFLDGRFVSWDQAKVHIMTHTLHYGGGVFEGIRFYDTEKGPAVFRLDEHIDRLFASAKVLEIKPPFNKEKFKKITLELIRKNKIKQGYIRPLIFLGKDKLGPSPMCCEAHTAIITIPFGAYLGTKGVKMKISSWRRLDPSTTEVHAKICGHYVNSMLASIEAYKNGFDEAIMLDREGYIAEGSAENIFMIKGNKLITPKKKNVLIGITRDTIMKIARDNKFKVTEENITPRRLKNADEVFLTGSATEVASVTQIDDHKFPRKIEKTQFLRGIYLDTVHGKIKKYNKWLTYV